MDQDNHLHDKYLSEPDKADIYFDYGPPLPEKYNQDTIFLLIHNPESIFCYWEVSGEIAKKISDEPEIQLWKWALRVLNITAKTYSDIPLDKPGNYNSIQGNYYLPVLPNTQYQVELGVFKSNGFAPLVKSNIITTPRKGKAPLTDISSYT